MASSCGFTYKDYDAETSTVKFAITTVTAANFDAMNTAVNSLSTAILAVQTENALQTKRVIAVDNFISRAKATEKASQRENKWLISLEDTTTHRITHNEIPLADSQYLATDSKYMDLSAGVGQALKTAIEAVVKFPGTGNGVNVLQIEYVGKRN